MLIFFSTKLSQFGVRRPGEGRFISSSYAAVIDCIVADLTRRQRKNLARNVRTGGALEQPEPTPRDDNPTPFR